MTLAAGRLRERVAIQSANLVDNGRGGRKPPPGEQPWKDVATKVRAEIIPLRGDEALSLGVQRSTQLYRVTIRKRAGVTTAHRLMWGEIALDIRSAPPSTDGCSIVLTCESGKVS